MIAWFIVPYKRKLPASVYGPRARYCAMDDFTSQIFVNGGRWSESEVLGGFAIVKVSASLAVVNAIDATVGFVRIPVAALDDPLSTLSAAKKIQIRDKVLEMGYTPAEVTADLGIDLGSKTLRELLVFITKRRRLSRYDDINDLIIMDGPLMPCKPIAQLDNEVS